VTLRVVGAGLGRTGTSSLKLALERLLDGRCHHMSGVLADPGHHLPLWAPVLSGEEVDWEEVFAGYVAAVDFPAAGFWREISQAFPDAVVVLSTRPADTWYRSAASMPAHAAVRSSAPPERFIEWTPADGWAPLCHHLALPVPHEPFPWTNTTAEFRVRNGLDWP
jgi:hypothetical protein